MSRLALLVPARNAAAHLGRLLDSARAQTSPFDEVLIYDDASGDATGDIARAFGAKVLRGADRTGPSAGKNILAEATDCGWVHFHDADDALAPEFVSRARGWMSEDRADVVLFATEDRDDETGRSLESRRWPDRELATDAVGYAIRNTITNCGLYRRDSFRAAGGFWTDGRFAYNEDQAMHVRLALAGLRFRADEYPGVVIYRRAASMSAEHPVECARAQVELLAHVADQTGRRYREAIGARAWRLAGVAAGYSDWGYVTRCLDVAQRVGYRVPREEHWLVRSVGALAPRAAVYGRERFIRVFKSHLRRGMPVAPAEARHSASAAGR